MEIEKIAEEIREILNKKREELQLTFEEEEHKYTMVDLDGNLRTDFPSVSKVMKLFYDEFPSEEKAYEMSGGDPDKTERLLNEWAEKGRKSTNMGSRVHYFLEEHVLKEFNISKEVRQPIFDCDAQQIIVSDTMIIAGKEYIKLLQDRGCVLLDTEIVLGHPELGYTGQPDKVWLVVSTKGEIGILITDWKTNQEKNFLTQRYTKPMKYPFVYLPNNALGHYKTQLPLYGKLILKMLEGSKYENVKLLGCIIVRLTEDRKYVEYRVDKSTIDLILNMDIKSNLTKSKKSNIISKTNKHE
jgi:hypothetical protein